MNRSILPFICLAVPLANAGTPNGARNDTGVADCYDHATPSETCMLAGHPGQDGRFGRDAAAALGLLPKIGAGRAGFDFTKIANDGSELPAGAALGSAPGDWACTRDNVTGFVWEVKTNDGGLRDRDWTYTWYNSDPGSNGGDPGTVGGDTCGSTLGSQCDTETYVTAVNAAGLCGGKDWRMPHSDEMQGVIDYSHTSGVAIDGDYFPNTLGAIYWSGDPYAATLSTAFAHFVDFYFDGAINMDMKMNAHHVKLVRAPVPSAGPAAPLRGDDNVTCVDENQAIPPSTDGAFTALPDGTVLDSRTGLIWDRCTLGQNHADDCSGGFGTMMNWQQALAEVHARNAANHLGHDDWRLPNAKEAGSITERRCQSPSIDQFFFPNSSNDPAYWTSTTHPAVPNTAWIIHFAVGLYAGPGNKALNHRVRLVRGGRPIDHFDSDLVFADGFDTPPESR